ncbi:MAG TPA: BamA/TamA family outer membrane protein [Candidatus Mcinerneyibacteriales bacterium]|nr:BamA/TamA family outer membrane protein [Candidatus Mcinerneyibacteriales bacterium]HPJ70210.1 BamA/TamA family outer membrane protein [Candidatus Mcinerneyibacteriales bacterium]
MKKILLFSLLLFMLLAQASGQFGRNKIRDKDFDWMTWETPHFVIHYYEDTAKLVKEVERILEETHDDYRNRMGITLKKKVPVVIYYNSKDFSQTNITDSELSEGVGGFTELSKRRLVLPYNGDIYDFKRILQHELVHVFQYEYIVPSDMPLSALYNSLTFPPLWVMEGMAEYFSEDWQPMGQMMLRENILSGEIPDIPLLGDEVFNYYGYYAYKLAQSFTEFLCHQYGEKKFIRYFKGLSKKITVRPEEEFKAVYGITMKRAVELWHHDLKQFYWQDGLEKNDPYSVFHMTEFKKPLSGDTDNVLLYAPKLSPAGDVVAVYSNLRDEGDIILIGAENGRFIRNLTAGYADHLYDYLQISPDNLIWSGEGDVIYFVARKVNTDVVVYKNIITGESRLISVPEISVIRGLAQCPDTGALLLLGQKENDNILLSYQPQTKEISLLATSFYYWESPAALGGGKVALVQRDTYGDAIIILDIKTGAKETVYQTQNINTLTYHDGALYFDRNFAHALYICRMDLKSGKTYQLMETINSTIHPDISEKKIVFNIYRDNRYLLAAASLEELKETLLVEESIPSRFEPVRITREDIREVQEGSNPYRVKLRADYLAGQMEYNSSGYFRSYATIMGMDIMGDYRFLINFDMTSVNSFDDINGQLAFNYMKKRYTLGAFVYTWKDYYFSDVSSFYDYSEQYTGGAVSLTYPLSEKDRLEGAAHIYQKKVEFLHLPVSDEAMAYTTQLAFVRDSSRWWGYYHPVSGYRLRLSYEQSYPVGASMEYGLGMADLRAYLKISRRMSLAQRLVYGESWGEDALPFKLGGISTVRGFDYQDLQGEKILLYNAEFRFPLVDYLLLAVPGFGFPNIRGVLFYDMAYVGSRDAEIRLFDNDKERLSFAPDVYGSYGLGLRYYLPGLFNLKFDWAWKTDLAHTLSDKAVFHFGISSDF